MFFKISMASAGRILVLTPTSLRDKLTRVNGINTAAGAVSFYEAAHTFGGRAWILSRIVLP